MFVGSLALFTLPVFIVVRHTAELLASASGVGPLTGVVHLLVVAGAALVALETASEIAAMRLRGMGVLQRGGQKRRLARHAVLAVSAVSVLVVAAEVVFGTVWWNVVHWNPAVVAAALVAAAALCWSGVRTVSSFRGGFREPTAGSGGPPSDSKRGSGPN